MSSGEKSPGLPRQPLQCDVAGQEPGECLRAGSHRGFAERRAAQAEIVAPRPRSSLPRRCWGHDFDSVAQVV